MATPFGRRRPTRGRALLLGKQYMGQIQGSEQAATTLSTCRHSEVLHKFTSTANEETVLTQLLMSKHFTEAPKCFARSPLRTASGQRSKNHLLSLGREHI